MTQKRFPKVPPDPNEHVNGMFTNPPAPGLFFPESTVCKHGLGECETCGTTDRRDVPHRTEGGVGKVGALRKKKNP